MIVSPTPTSPLSLSLFLSLFLSHSTSLFCKNLKTQIATEILKELLAKEKSQDEFETLPIDVIQQNQGQQLYNSLTLPIYKVKGYARLVREQTLRHRKVYVLWEVALG